MTPTLTSTTVHDGVRSRTSADGGSARTADGDPHRREDIAFGETLHIPEPFDFDLVTGDLLPY
ncbi:hypothetical protein ACIG5E_37315 [Kitasatospora sp. NPDC053057]|uniref:hypothetical protein n=1 Tax=Kitasatospora sp. NPDC053057 TaxID=3364062 RepID=UPI0037C99014